MCWSSCCCTAGSRAGSAKFRRYGVNHALLMNNSTLAQRGAAKLQGRTSPPHPTVHHGVTIVSLLADSVRSMGNTGGFSSVGPSTPVEGLSFSSDLEASGQAEGGFRHGGGAALSDSQLRELAQSFQGQTVN